MKKNHWVALVSLCAMLAMFLVGLAEAGTGTLKFNLKYKDPATGVETNVEKARTYLHNATKPPPMERFYSKADYILWGSFGNGLYSIANFPEGTWYLRINQRALPANQTDAKSLGPPQTGDLTWMQTAPITITAGQILDLGTIYANPFAPVPITISGTVKNQNGVPLAGRYVRAQSEPCYEAGYDWGPNQCGPVKNLALQPTDANGKYTLQLKDPGTYYIYASPCITTAHDDYTGNRCTYTAAPLNPVLVKIRDTKTVDFVVPVY